VSTDPKTNPDHLDDADLDQPSTPEAIATAAIIERFGGIRPLAGKLDIPVTTVQGWKNRGVIPPSRHAEIIAAAARHNIMLDDLELAFAAEPAESTADTYHSTPKPYASLVTPPLGKNGLHSVWLALVTTIFVVLAVSVALAGFYMVKQKENQLEKRVAGLESNTRMAPSLEARLAALEATRQATADPATAPHLQDIDRRLAELGTTASQVALLSQKVSDLQATSGNHDLLTQTVTTLQGSVQTLSQSLEGLREKVTQLSGQVGERRLESAHQFALLLSIGQLRAAAQTAQPFDVELNAARNLAHGDSDFSPDLDALATYAGDGAPTMNDLRLEFSDIATEIVRSNVVGSGKSWFRQALYRLGSVISVRKIGSKSHDNTAEVLVSRAEGKLEEDDLAGAVQSLAGLTGLPKDVASAWVEAANRRLAVDAALASLSSNLVERAETLGASPAPVATGVASQPSASPVP
jgi:hypothetical protein